MGMLDALNSFKDTVENTADVSPVVEVEASVAVSTQATSEGVNNPLSLEDDTLLVDCLSRTQIIQDYVDSIFRTYNLTSAHIGFFGDYAKGITPHGYVSQTVGEFTFLIKATEVKRLSALITLLDQVKNTINTVGSVAVPLCIKRSVEGASVYSLAITEEEIQEIRKSFPEYKFGYTDTATLQDLKLVIKR